MTGEEFIRVAGKIAAAYVDAASCRTAIGRAYYGAFHLCKVLLSGLGKVAPRNANTHSFVQRSLQNCGFRPAVVIGRLLQDLYADRLLADYELFVVRTESVVCARTAVETAQRILVDVQSLSEDDRNRIRAGIDAYEAATAQPGRYRHIDLGDNPS